MGSKIRCWLKTRHKYIKTGERLIDIGMGKMIFYKCELCGKEKVKVN